jgi:hypothetical protein
MPGAKPANTHAAVGLSPAQRIETAKAIAGRRDLRGIEAVAGRLPAAQ